MPESDSLEVDTITYTPAPGYGDIIELSLDTDFNDTLAVVVVYAREYSSPEACKCSVMVYIGLDPPRGTATDFDSRNSYLGKYLPNLVTMQYVSSDSVGSDTLSSTNYFYDDTSYIVKGYVEVAQWEEPPEPSKLRGNLTRIERWKGDDDYTKSEFRYDKVGNVVRNITHASDSEAETTYIHYDLPYQPRSPDYYQYAFPWRVVNYLSNSACSLSTRTEYDVHTGFVIRIVDEGNADSTMFTYDSLNRITKVWYPNQSLLEPSKIIHYKDSDSPEAIVDSIRLDGSRWIGGVTFFDGFGRTIQTKRFDYSNNVSIVQNILYNGNGLKDSICNPYEVRGVSAIYSSPSWSQVTSYQYDGLNRTTKITHPDDKDINIRYYAHTDTIIDEKGNKSVHIYNAYGQIDTVIDAYNNKTCYNYDTLGRLTSVTDAENKVTKYYYDILGRLVAVDGPDAKSPYTYPPSGPRPDTVDVLYEYDDVNNLTLKKDANGWVSYTYDDIYRLTEVLHSTNQGSTWRDTVLFMYDSVFINYGPGPLYNNPKGRLGKMKTSGVDTIYYFYNDRGNLSRKAIEIVDLNERKVIDYKYNQAGLCTLLIAPPGQLTKYNYDQLGRLTDIPDLVNTFRYIPSGQIRKIIYANGDIDTMEYDNRLRPTHIKAYNVGTYFDISYTYEDNSNVASIVDNLSSTYTQTFVYDNLNRLDSVLSSAGNQSFTYDKVGNRLSKNGTSYQYYTGTNRLQQDHRSYTYDYDDNGNIIRHRDGATVDSFAYDWNNRLLYYKKGNEVIDFKYNASGLRIKKYYHTRGLLQGEQGEYGTMFSDPSDDLGLKSEGADSIYNKGRDIVTIGIEDTQQYYDFTFITQYLFNASDKVKLFITIDIDTIENSGRITLPEDKMTLVSKKAAWEYCLYIDDDEFGIYKPDGTKISKPFGMSVEKTFGLAGMVKVKVAKSLINKPQAVRFTISTFDPEIQLPSLSPNTLFHTIPLLYQLVHG